MKLKIPLGIMMIVMAIWLAPAIPRTLFAGIPRLIAELRLLTAQLPI